MSSWFKHQEYLEEERYRDNPSARYAEENDIEYVRTDERGRVIDEYQDNKNYEENTPVCLSCR